MHEDKLEGRITVGFRDRRAKELHAQAGELLRKVNEILAATPAPVKAAIDLMDLTSQAADLSEEVPERQRFLHLVRSH